MNLQIPSHFCHAANCFAEYFSLLYDFHLDDHMLSSTLPGCLYGLSRDVFSTMSSVNDGVFYFLFGYFIQSRILLVVYVTKVDMVQLGILVRC